MLLLFRLRQTCCRYCLVAWGWREGGWDGWKQQLEKFNSTKRNERAKQANSGGGESVGFSFHFDLFILFSLFLKKKHLYASFSFRFVSFFLITCLRFSSLLSQICTVVVVVGVIYINLYHLVVIWHKDNRIGFWLANTKERKKEKYNIWNVYLYHRYRKKEAFPKDKCFSFCFKFKKERRMQIFKD